MAWTCPECGVRFGRENPLHLQVCRQYPGAAQLRELIDAGLSMRALADEYGVDRSVIQAWLQRAQLAPPKTPVKQEYGRPALDLIDHLKTARCISCNDCKRIAECRIRDFTGRWVHCEKPERSHVELCIREGLEPADVLIPPLPYGTSRPV